MTDLDKLIDAVEAGVDPSLWIDSENLVYLYDDIHAASEGSLDSAKVLHEELLPGWFPGVSQNIHSGYWYAWVQDKFTSHYSSTEATPARAWLIAVLKAYRSMQ